MNIRKALLAALLSLPGSALWSQEENPNLGVLAWDFSDPGLTTEVGDSCSELISYLTGKDEKYTLLSVAGVAGPPGVVYSLQNIAGETAIIKCGTAGGHGGGCEG